MRFQVLLTEDADRDLRDIYTFDQQVVIYGSAGGTTSNAPVQRKTSFDVLHLLAHLLDDDLHVHRVARRLEVL